MTQEQSLRYARHTMLPEMGEAGQIKLLKSKVLLPRRRRARLAGGALPGGGRRRHDRVRRRRHGRRVEPAAADHPLDRSHRDAQGRIGGDRHLQAEPRREGHPAQDAARLGQRPRHHQGLRPDRRRRRQLPDPLPDQRRGAEAEEAGGRRQHLPVRRDGHHVPAVRAAPATAASTPSRRRPTWRPPARRRACSACCAA